MNQQEPTNTILDLEEQTEEEINNNINHNIVVGEEEEKKVRFDSLGKRLEKEREWENLLTFFVHENSQFWDDDNKNFKNDISTEPCDFQYSKSIE